MLVRMPSKASPHPKFIHPGHFTVLVPCIGLVILDPLCSQPAHCPHCHLHSLLHPILIFILSSSLPYSYPLAAFDHCSRQTKRLLTPKELLAYTTPSLSVLASHATITYYWYHHHQVFCCSSNSISYLVQSCPLQTSQPHLYISLLQHALPRNCSQGLTRQKIHYGQSQVLFTNSLPNIERNSL